MRGSGPTRGLHQRTETRMPPAPDPHTADTHDVRLALVADHQAVLRPLQITATTDRVTMFPTVAAARAVT
jgi:hypothetical protein